MNHSDQTSYAAFCRYVADHPEADNLECVKHVMQARGGCADPNMVTEWYHMWSTMRHALAHHAVALPGESPELDLTKPLTVQIGEGVVNPAAVQRFNHLKLIAEIRLQILRLQGEDWIGMPEDPTTILAWALTMLEDATCAPKQLSRVADAACQYVAFEPAEGSAARHTAYRDLVGAIRQAGLSFQVRERR